MVVQVEAKNFNLCDTCRGSISHGIQGSAVFLDQMHFYSIFCIFIFRGAPVGFTLFDFHSEFLCFVLELELIQRGMSTCWLTFLSSGLQFIMWYEKKRHKKQRQVYQGLSLKISLLVFSTCIVQ